MDKLAQRVFLLLLLGAPLAFGAAGPWSKIVLEGLCFLLLLLLLLHLRSGESPFYEVPGLLPLLLLAGIPLFQLIPFPPPILRLLSPKTWELYSESIWIARSGTWMPLSVAPKATLAEFFRFAAAGAFYLATVQIFAERDRLRKTITFVAIASGVLSLAAILLYTLYHGGAFGEWPLNTPYSSTVEAYKSRYPGLMAMLLPVVLAQFLANRPEVSYSSVWAKIAEFFRSPWSSPHVPIGFSLALLIAALLLSLSLPGILSAFGALLTFLLLLLLRGGGARKKGGLLPLYTAAVLIVFAFSVWGMVRGDSGHGTSLPGAGERELLWRDAINIVGDFPLLGAGLGAFGTIYPRYKSVPTEEGIVEHPGNEYLEHAAEGGLVVILLVGWFLLSVLRQTYPLWRTRHSRTAVYLYLGSLSGLAAALLHSFTGSALHGTSSWFYFFFLAGLAVASATITSRGGKTHVERGAVLPARLRLAIVPAILLLFVGLAFNTGVLAGKLKFAAVGNPGIVESGPATQRGIELAAHFDPLEPRYRYALADSALASGHMPATLDRFSAALRLNPSNAEYLQRLGLVFDNLGEREKAERLLRSGVQNDRSNPERHKTFAFWLLSGGNMDKGLDHVRQGIFWGPQKTREFLALMALYGMNDEEMRRVLPERSVPLLVYGDYLVGIGKEAGAEESYRAAIRQATREERPNPAPFQRVAEYYAERGRYHQALEVIEQGIGIFPKNAEFRYSAASFYERLGITYRAIEEYRSSLGLDPGNSGARQSLKKLVGDSR